MGKIGRLWSVFLTFSLVAGMGGRPGAAAAAGTEAGLPFTDVAPADSYYEAVVNVYRTGIMNGTGPETFSPDGSATRAMAATVLYRMEGCPAVDGENPFPDVPAGAWYTQAIQWAAEEMIYQGYEDGRFHPEENVTREQL